MPLSITESQYERIITLAMLHDPIEGRALRTEVDDANDIKRYGLLIRWQDLGGTVPPLRELGKPWPPSEQFWLELLRPIIKSDVDDVLRTRAVNPAIVQVTPDPMGRVGWSDFTTYFEDS